MKCVLHNLVQPTFKGKTCLVISNTTMAAAANGWFCSTVGITQSHSHGPVSTYDYFGSCGFWDLVVAPNFAQKMHSGKETAFGFRFRRSFRGSPSIFSVNRIVAKSPMDIGVIRYEE